MVNRAHFGRMSKLDGSKKQSRLIHSARASKREKNVAKTMQKPTSGAASWRFVKPKMACRKR